MGARPGELICVGLCGVISRRLGRLLLRLLMMGAVWEGYLEQLNEKPVQTKVSETRSDRRASSSISSRDRWIPRRTEQRSAFASCSLLLYARRVRWCLYVCACGVW